MKKCITRREMVVGALATTAAACASIPRYNPSELPLRVPLSAFDETGRLVVEYASLPYPIFVSRVGGEYIAVRMECTHAGCPVNARRADLICHCHGSKFADDGAVLKGPAEKPLPRYPTRVEDDAIVIEL